MKYLIAVLLLLACPGFVSATGVNKITGDTAVWTCAAPTTFADGTPIPTGTAITYTVYATQTPPTTGNAIATSSTCNISVSTAGLALGQWHSYITATVAGRPESLLSNDAPFSIVADPTSPPSPPTNVQVQ